MREEEIERYLQLGEDSVCEFKSVAHTAQQPQHRAQRGRQAGEVMDAHILAKAIVALANTRGGHLFLGVEDDGTPTGVGDTQQADALMRQVTQVCTGRIHPSLFCTIEKASYRGALLLIVEVPPFSPDRPYREDKTYYVRAANQSREATRDELVRLLQSPDYHFDEQPVASAARGDLDERTVAALFAQMYQVPPGGTQETRYLNALKCIDRGGVPTVAGVLMLGREPGLFLPDARVTGIRFVGNTMTSEFADRQEIGGRLLDQIDGALAFLARHVTHPSHLEGAARVESGIPAPVLREAMTNAIAHRDYRAASQTRVFVFDDRIEVINPGQLLNQLTLDSIRLGGISQRRNPVIASLLSRAARRENIGMGIPEMARLMTERGLPEPEFDIQGGHFRLVLRTQRK